MAHEVVVVGGGIGGLTVAALLAARGVDVCLLERQSEVGGCVASLEKFNYNFEPTLGLYAGWSEGQIFPRIFTELPVDAPETLPLEPAYVVRLPGNPDVGVSSDRKLFAEELQRCFPECSAHAIEFYRQSLSICDVLLEAFRKVPDFLTASRPKQLYSLLASAPTAAQLLALRKQTLGQRLKKTSEKFKRFLELQLQTFSGSTLNECSYLAACVLLNLPRLKPAAIRGGAASLANRLEESIKKSGGKVRRDSPVLRLSYDSSGYATGVNLLSGENIVATKAIISNMTVWDTYGKLIGLNQTPADVKKQLSGMKTSGAYLIYAGIDEAAISRLPSERLLIATASPSEPEHLIDTSRLWFAAAPQQDPRGPEGMRAVTITFPTDVDHWFIYQADAAEHEERDQLALELGWQTVHAHISELGADIEVIETANPQSYYESTRRKLGMVGGLVSSEMPARHVTSLPNVFMVGDTAFPAGGVAGASLSALIVADEITQS